MAVNRSAVGLHALLPGDPLLLPTRQPGRHVHRPGRQPTPWPVAGRRCRTRRRRSCRGLPVSRGDLDAAVADGPGAAAGGGARKALQVVSAHNPDRAPRAEGSEGEGTAGLPGGRPQQPAGHLRPPAWGSGHDPQIRVRCGEPGRLPQPRRGFLRPGNDGEHCRAAGLPTALANFGRALAEWTGGGRYAFASWEEALDLLFTAVGGKLIVIDEFPYLTKASPALPSLVQRALEPRGIARRSGSRLLLCGSAMAVMGSLLSGNSPLRGRASLEVVIRPLGYRDAASFWGITDPRLAGLVH